MHKKTATTFFFVMLLVLTIAIFGVGKLPFISNLNGIATFFTIPIQQGAFSLFGFNSENSQLQELREENAKLQKKIIDQKKLAEDNQALRDQFRVNKPTNASLLPAKVIGAPGLLPGVSQPQELVLNVGKNNGVSQGQAVVVNNNLVGRISRVSYGLSVVAPIQTSQISFTARTLETNATGIVISTGTGGLQLDGIVLSDTLKKDDIVVTKGEVSSNGVGIPPDIVVGKIISIDKEPSALFQTAKIQPLVDISKVYTVFIVFFQK